MKYNFAHGGFNGAVHFSERQWKQIERIAKAGFTQDHREAVHVALLDYALWTSCSENEYDVSELEKPLEEIIKGGKRICDLVLVSDFSSPTGEAIRLLRREFGGPKGDGSDIAPIYHKVADLVVAARKALQQLATKGVATKSGSKHGPILEQLLERLGSVYEFAGGRAVVGTRRPKSAPQQKGSPFGDFVYLCLAIARHQISQPLPRLTRSAVAYAIREHRRRLKQPNGG